MLFFAETLRPPDTCGQRTPDTQASSWWREDISHTLGQQPSSQAQHRPTAVPQALSGRLRLFSAKFYPCGTHGTRAHMPHSRCHCLRSQRGGIFPTLRAHTLAHVTNPWGHSPITKAPMSQTLAHAFQHFISCIRFCGWRGSTCCTTMHQSNLQAQNVVSLQGTRVLEQQYCTLWLWCREQAVSPRAYLLLSTGLIFFLSNHLEASRKEQEASRIYWQP